MESKFIKFFIIFAFLLLNGENIDGGKNNENKNHSKGDSTSPLKEEISPDHHKDEDSLNIMEKGLKRLNLCPKQIDDGDRNASKISETINAKTSGTKNGENTDHQESVKMVAKKLKRINLRLKQADNGNENVSKRKEKSTTINAENSEKQNKRKNPSPDHYELPNIITNGMKQLNLENTGENDRPIGKQNKKRRIDRNEAENIGAKGIKILYG